MRTTVDIDEELLRSAQEYAPVLSKKALIEDGLRALIQREAQRRLVEAAGTQPDRVGPFRQGRAAR